MTKLRAQSDATYRSLKRLPPAGQSDTADRASEQVLASRLASIQASIAELVSTDTFPGEVSSAATLPSAPDGFNPGLLIAVAALFGLGLGAAVAVWRQARDDTLGVATGPTVASLPVLAVLPRLPGTQAPLLTDGQTADDTGEWFRQLKIGMVSSAPQAKSFSVSHVSSAVPTGTHTANLGITMATAGLRIAMVDGCPPGTPGALLEVLGGQLTAGPTAKSVQRLPIPGGNDIVVLSASSPDDELPIVDESRLAQLIRNQARHVDYVLVAAPSLTTADGELTCLATSASVLVAEQGRSTTSEIQAIVDRAGMVGVRLCGLFSVPRGEGSHRHFAPFRGVITRLAQLVRRSSPADTTSGDRAQTWPSRPAVDES
jgi:Mrp family chromosome partitioning ATPase